MRILCWSLWLVGICLTDAVHAGPLASQQAVTVRDQEAREWQIAEIPGSVRLALAKVSPGSRVALCFGFEVQLPARDGKHSTSELLDLEMRSKVLANQLGEHAPGSSPTWTRFALTEGATLTECLSVPTEDYASALHAMLETLRPLLLKPNDCAQTLEQWRRHEGLARLVDHESLAHRAHELAWLGSRPQQASIATELQRIDSEACTHWQPLGTSNPSIATLIVIGAPDVAATEKTIRADSAVRQRQRSVRPRYPKAASPPKLPESTCPRFVRVHSPRSTESSLMVAWPVVRRSERYELGLRQIASLIEERLGRAWGPHANGHATVRLHWSGFEGMLGIEVRPTTPGDLASTEERIFAVLDQLRSAPVSTTELNSLLVDVNTRPPLTGDLDLDQALHMAQKSLFSWNPRVMVKTPEVHPTAAELQQWIREGFSRLSVTEVLSEAPTMRRQTAVQGHIQTPIGFSYTVKAGESLQMIAHKFHATILDLIRVNHLHHPDQIAPGTRLTIPNNPRANPSN
jgi:hypothetical protein